MASTVIVAAMSENRVIGKKDSLPWNIKEELEHFKKITLGKSVVMGRKTFESIGKVLPDRETIVVTRNPDWSFPGVLTASSLDDAISKASSDVMISGGGEIYKQALDKATLIILSTINGVFDGDTYFPELDEDWVLVTKVPHDEFTVEYFLKRFEE